MLAPTSRVSVSHQLQLKILRYHNYLTVLYLKTCMPSVIVNFHTMCVHCASLALLNPWSSIWHIVVVIMLGEIKNKRIKIFAGATRSVLANRSINWPTEGAVAPGAVVPGADIHAKSLSVYCFVVNVHSSKPTLPSTSSASVVLEFLHWIL